MGRTSRTLSTPRPSSRVVTRGRVAVRGRKTATAAKRRPGDRRTETAEGRRAKAAMPAAKSGTRKRTADLEKLAAQPETSAPLTEEEQIESAKYLPRHVPKRVFEEERFLFPETYGIDRVRLLIKDPEWLFAYWDLSSRSVDMLRRELGERGMALTRLTLRISDPGRGGTSVILLPYGARAWYVRADTKSRSYRAQLGWTLPSGQFRTLAESNLVSTPRQGPSPDKARRRVRFDAPLDAVKAAAGAPAETEPGPWQSPPPVAAATEGPARKRGRGGASDAFRR
jgi:hypothetical protein